MTYTTELFTNAHKAHLDSMSEEDYHTLAAKHTSPIKVNPMAVSSPTFQADLESALKEASVVCVSGVMTTTPDGDMEEPEMYKKLVGCVKLAKSSGIVGKRYIHILGFNITPYPPPKFLKSLEEGKYTLEGGFWAPGQPMLEQCVIAVYPEDGDVELTTCVMASQYSNFNQIKTEGITASHLGCDPAIVPAAAMDVAFLSAEHAIQLAKAQAAVGLPDAYMDCEASDASIEKAEAGLEKLQQQAKTLKRKPEGSKA
jgi:hypothetical protein